MCGRFTLTGGLEFAVDQFRVDEVELEFSPRYNIAPTQKVAVVVDEEGKRRLVSFRWGLIPAWAKDESIGNRLINARAETVADKRIFRSAFLKRRCLILADGFYEWKKEGGRKLPTYIRLKSGKPFGFAGLWEKWTSPGGEQVLTCTIITTEPNELVKEIHHRMPVILTGNSADTWLNPNLPVPVGRGLPAQPSSSGGELPTKENSEQLLLSILKPYPAEEMEAYWVSKEVNSPRNDFEALTRPAD